MTVSAAVPTCGQAHECALKSKATEEGAPICERSVTDIRPTAANYPTQLSIEEITVESPALFDDIDEAVAAARLAQVTFARMPLSSRKRIIQAIRDIAITFAKDFALSAWSETGRGRYEDKLSKQYLAAKSTPGVEDLNPVCFTGDCGMTVIDYAPYGVLGAVTPVTNPTATVVNNAITILSGGNAVVFNPHPAAKACTNRAVAVVTQAITGAGGPVGLVASVRLPTIPSGQRLLTHPDTAANLVTGGPAVVKVALSSGKKSFCAGPGNPPVLVDETADAAVAAKGIYAGASFDNNMICSDEKEVFVVEKIYDQLIEEFRKVGAYIATPEEIQKLTEVCIPEERSDWHHGLVDRFLVGQNANVLLKRIGVDVPESCRLVIAQVPASHPLVWTEQLMPVMPVVKVKSFEEGLTLCVKAEYGFRHTSCIYSSNLQNITQMGTAMNTSLFIVNGPTIAGLAAGGEGYTSFSIAGATGEGMTRPRTFVRERRLVIKDAMRFI